MKLFSAVQAVAIAAISLALLTGCGQKNEDQQPPTRAVAPSEDVSREAVDAVKPNNFPSSIGAMEILGKPEFLAFSYGGYRERTRDNVPTVNQLKEDMRILSAMGIKLLRTYNTQQYPHAANLLEAIGQLRAEDPEFEMYVMLGAWIDCEGAWTDAPNHEGEDFENNSAEIEAAVKLAQAHPETVKIIAVGNEAMVHWATSYFVRPAVILKWVDHLQELKASGKLPANLWVTSSDNFASWGGGDTSYHTDELTALIKSVDFISMHTYPFHDTHYNPSFWAAPAEEAKLTVPQRADAAIERAAAYAISQYEGTAEFVKSLEIEKPIHIGETGWASSASSLYGASGSQAADEYKSKRFYDAMRDWTNQAGMSCFYFEAFDEQWKDDKDPGGSENHFGLINLQGQAKYALWDQVDAGLFEALTRDGKPITKTYDGDETALLASALNVPSAGALGAHSIATVNEQRGIGEAVGESIYVVLHDGLVPDESNDATYPSQPLKLNIWEGTCGLERVDGDTIRVSTGSGDWWGCALEIQADGKGENLAKFTSGRLHFEIRGDSTTPFNVGIQSGTFAAGTQVNNFVSFGSDKDFQLSQEWKSYSIPLADLEKENGKVADYSDITSLLFVKGTRDVPDKSIELRRLHYTRN